MAQYYTDFEEYTAGETPSDWTPKLDATANWLIYEDVTFGKCLRNTSTASGRKLITWDAVPDTADVEVYFEFFAPVGTLVVATYGAARVDPSKNTSAANAEFYRFGFDEETLNAGDTFFDKYLSGTFTSVTSAERDLGVTGATVFACRASFVGTAVKVRCWDTAGAEPSTWDIETTDSSISAAGAVGLFRFSTFNAGNYRYNAFGVGTGGDPAPTSAPASTAVSFTGTVPTQNLTQDSAMSALDLSTYFSGTETPFSYAVQTGTLPAGLSLNSSTGVISGTPTATGTASIVVRATDQTPDTADTNSFDIVVASAATAISFTGTVPTQNLTEDVAMTSLDLTSYFSGSETPFTYAIQSGTLPTGLSLSSGVISGTPTQVGTFPIVVRGTDDATNTADTNSFNIVVASAVATVTVTDPLKNNTGTLWASETGIKASVLNATTLESVYEVTGLTTNGSGVLEAISNAALNAGDSYHVAIKLSDGSVGVTGPITAT